MSYTVHQAKTNLSKLIKEAEEGKEVIITRGKVPVAKLVAFSPAEPKQGKKQRASAYSDPDALTDEDLHDLGLG